jgi:hypothetical protein
MNKVLANLLYLRGVVGYYMKVLNSDAHKILVFLVNLLS